MSRDVEGRRVIDIAQKDIAEVLQEKIFFLGRYDISPGTVVHHSSTSCVVEAIDSKAGNDYRKLFQEIAKHKKNFRTAEVTKETIKTAIGRLGLDQDDDIFKHHIKFWDVDQSGDIDEGEFEKFCKRLNNDRPRKVNIKFMLNEVEFEREVEARNKVKGYKNVEEYNKNMLCVLASYQHELSTRETGLWRDESTGIEVRDSGSKA